MDVGLGLPTVLDGVEGTELVDWATAGEQAGFSVLGSLGRFVYHNHEELTTFAAAAGATRRIEFMPTVMVGPPRNNVVLAKQAATLDHLSLGRFRLGVGIGGRADDYAVTGADYEHRGALLDEQLDALRSLWAQETPDGADRPIGPAPYTPGGPMIVLGGFASPALRRAGRRGDGFLLGPVPLDRADSSLQVVRDAAEAAGRPTPRLFAARYFALGDVDDEVWANSWGYYGSMGGESLAKAVYQGVLRTTDDIRQVVDGLGELGVEELCLWPMARHGGQVEAVADAVRDSLR
jgi:alkanesulfonate monooxygenase SsuD/methylene tetrahydromethanopterin reductase-like flavin-dependent oxidoreductase (luciferase family)